MLKHNSHLFISIVVFIFCACQSAPKKDQIKNHNDQLELVKELRAVSSASGLVIYGNQAYVVADDEPTLYSFSLTRGVDSTYPLSKLKMPSDPKELSKVKPDYEALFKVHLNQKDYLVSVGSGSKPSRYMGAVFDPQTAKVKPLDFAPLFKALLKEIPDLNIEGATEDDNYVMLFQRGEAKGDSAIIFLDKKLFYAALSSSTVSEKTLVRIDKINLGSWGKTPLAFSDAKYVPGQGVYFLASAEQASGAGSSWMIVGTVLGRLGPKNEVQELARFAGEKFEGLEVVQKNSSFEFYFVNDPDDRSLTARLMKFVVP